MRKELELHLVDRFPDMFRDYGGDPKLTCMAWGLTCGDGWFGILCEMCVELDAYLSAHSELKKDFCFLQIKEKFGLARIYARGTDQAISDIIHQSELHSAKVCEECGTQEDNVTTQGGWIRTLCDPCRKAGKRT